MKFTHAIRTFLCMTLVALLLTISSFAQAPEKMSYQAVVRNAANALLTNQQVGMQISILQGATAVYVETHTPTSNTNGLVSLEIGLGTVVSGSFTEIDWTSGAYFIKTETDPIGGTNYTITGTSQLLSVPYALYAKTAANGISGAQTTAITDNTTAIGLNTAKDTNVSTDLTITGTTGARVLVSSDGTDATIPVATAAVSGVMSKATYDEHLVNNNKTGITSDQTSAITANTTKVTTLVATIAGLESRIAALEIPPTTVPDPPIIVNATTENAKSTVSFTAPVSDGGSAITEYTVTSNPGGLAAKAGISPITITGLSNGTAYTFSVTATNAKGTSNPSSASNSVTPANLEANIGDLREGGIVFWVDPEDNTKGKVCALSDAPTLLNWDAAVTYCNEYTNPGTGGYEGWYLPSKDELQLMYANLQRFGCTTNTPEGRDNDSCSTKKGGFIDYYYWSSTKRGTTMAHTLYFKVGFQNYSLFATPLHARAVRAF
ncbi:MULTISPECIES: DUF1566 domain-containing protein [unclassified Polaribacter]|uniref:Lcl domain-containing protein n=1 Tax=unclassified Polaribacter TaxID=196858 RepID=UPI001677EED3|nr:MULTISPECIES: DUF1566 domain-containing protein [unclassified Polaribacter]